ncbi:hypothetical protein [Streptomyces sp. NPDC004528]|uniref:hypothetical protein n=1 Tax=Streptomyces sp. NPDC004528 TaxID=3154550 RepID=UPI0033B758F8
MNYRPYPRVRRALHQLERGRVPAPPCCPICDHPVNRHAIEDGQRVCTQGLGRISCRDCAELRARMPAVAGITSFAMAWHHGTGRRILVEHPRRSGKAAIVEAILDQAVKAGEVVHVAGRDGELAAPQVPEATPIVLARAVRTCAAVPSQWNAWTVDGQYLYLRYRSGIGTVDAYDDEDSDTWTRIPDGAVARFDTGDRQDGETDLVEFCEQAGLQVADDAQVIGE